MKILNLTLLMTLAISECYASDSNIICISPVKEKEGDKGVIVMPPGSSNFGHTTVFDYKVQVDNGPQIKPSQSDSTIYPSVKLKTKQLVKIYSNEKLQKSFYFSFNHYPENKVCLYFNNLYETWSLYPLSDQPKLCSCKQT